MVLLPIARHERRPGARPVAVTLTVLCVVVQVYRSAFAPSEEEHDQADAAVEEAQLAVLAEEHVKLGFLPAQQQAAYAVLERVRRDAAYRQPKVRAAMLDAEARQAALRAREPIFRYGYSPARPASPAIVGAAFLHAGWAHLIGNFVVFLLISSLLEARWGWRTFLGLYVAGAVAANLGYLLMHAGEKGVAVGASGAIAATMGAYAVALFRENTRYWLWRYWPGTGARVTTFSFPSTFVLPLWVGEQIAAIPLEQWNLTSVAVSAHVAGFAFGVAFGWALKASGRDEALQRPEVEVKDAVSYAPLDLPKPPEPVESADGRLDELELALTGGDGARAGAVGAAVLEDLLKKQRQGELLKLFARLAQAAAPLPERVLAGVLRTALECDEPKLAFEAAKALATRFPQSPLAPGALWQIARLQEAGGRPELARKTLAHLAAKYPLDAFGQQAKKKLG